MKLVIKKPDGILNKFASLGLKSDTPSCEGVAILMPPSAWDNNLMKLLQKVHSRKPALVKKSRFITVPYGPSAEEKFFRYLDECWDKDQGRDLLTQAALIQIEGYQQA